MTNSIISVKNLTKSYRLYSNHTDRLIEAIWPKKPRHTLFYALHDVTFEIQPGEHFGIIGINGAGKSTLLQILSGVLTPTSGSFEVNGRVAALLELGAGFNPELSGRENVAFFMQLHHLPQKEISHKIDEVERFAEIGDYFEQPVKFYSSGMYVRVAFAAAMLTDPDILIVDEALSVGDVKFSKKCYDRMSAMKKNNTTIILVTHDIFTAKSFCQSLILLNQGKIVSSGDPIKVANDYLNLLYPKSKESEVDYFSNNVEDHTSKEMDLTKTEKISDYRYVYRVLNKDIKTEPWGRGGVKVEEVRFYNVTAPDRIMQNQKLIIQCDYRLDNDILRKIIIEKQIDKNLMLAIRIDNQKGIPITTLASGIHGDGLLEIDIETISFATYEFSCILPLLARGNYFFTPEVSLGTQDNFVPIIVYENFAMLTYEPDEQVHGIFKPEYSIKRIQ